MESDYLILRRASAFRPSGEWNDEDYDVLADGIVVGRIMKAAAVQVGSPWMCPPTTMRRHARPRWRRSRRVGAQQ
jgi:hypothetical protein